MAPNMIGSSFLLAETSIAADNEAKSTVCNVNNRVPNPCEPPATEKVTTNTNESKQSDKKEYHIQIVWRNVILFVIIHAMAIYGLYLVIAERAILEFFYGLVMGTLGGFGITAGAHRLWSHRAYKAKWPMRVFLMLCQTLAFQNSIYEWVRDHRVHHKFTDTDADPHNSRRGFFFSHMGWLLCRKHPHVKEKGKQIDMSDLEADPIVMFQKKYYLILMPTFCFLLPPLLPYYLFGSSFKVAFFMCSMYRYVISLHYTWLVNSAAHIYGMKPYDSSISASNNKIVAILTYGEGWHNYHHVFPWDYKAAELGTYACNWSTALINAFAKVGLAYDLKTVSEDMIRKRVARTGDGTHESVTKEINNNNTPTTTRDDLVTYLNHENEENLVWGWDDKDMLDDDRREACIIAKKDD